MLIEGARVFDGTGAKARVAKVLVRDGRIVAIGPDVEAPTDVERVDGRGKTLIPGLFDLHTHTRSPAYQAPEDLPKAWAGYLLNGVTTINDFSVSGEMIAPIRALVEKPGGFWAPHLNQAIRFGVPGGHGTEYGWGSFFTMQTTTARAAHFLMPRALSYDPDLIKVFADGWRYGRDPDVMSMNEHTLSAIVKDAHAAGKPVITHTVTLEGAKVAAAAGVDAVGHGVGDALIDDELIKLMRRKGTAYIATLVVYEPQQERVLSAAELDGLDAGERADEVNRRGGPIREYDTKRWKIMRENIGRLKKANIPIGIGSDAGIGGVYHGHGAVREIWWLAQLGLSPAEALVAATKTSAEIIDKDGDRGTIEPGKRADLVLVDGSPDKDIDDIWKVARVWQDGREVPLAELRAMRDRPETSAMPVEPMTGPVLSQAREDGRTDLDTLPVATTDPGIDHSHLIAVDKPGGKPVFLAAQMGASPRPYVQWVLPLTRGPINVADASGFTGVELIVRGEGDYRMVIESYGLDGSEWFAAPFAPKEEAHAIRLPFERFRSRSKEAVLDLKQLRALRVHLAGKTGETASLEVDTIRFYRD
ncbi:D-hydantoinase/dihydropyrimidinase [Tsuneonella dongtanensis]|uniref:D-hydantoinase/dihydropyrimidinase n=1 Tax=Tsuneonella dongtanensis TaxID=692370 RepID=A0A1B2AFQ0_9SPHN|nr:amidohydrolase family protein [Tsuneonella dongtanensis]ANY20956.1 D-hydantoinase/dihydropyrimidinase [Tsuneonella dongtanensis]